MVALPFFFFKHLSNQIVKFFLVKENSFLDLLNCVTKLLCSKFILTPSLGEVRYMKRNSDKFYGVDFRILSFVCIAVNLNKTSSYTFGKINSRAEYGVASHASLSIRRFWGKGERWKRKRERAEREKLFSPSPLPYLKSPLP